MPYDTLLLQTADVLEKAAAYIENLETTRLTQELETKTKTAADLAQKLSQATGEPATADMVQKLAALSPDMQQVIARLAGTETVDSLGGPPNTGTEKQAGVSPGMPPEDTRFLNWLVGD
jgi:hypothetical protein